MYPIHALSPFGIAALLVVSASAPSANALGAGATSADEPFADLDYEAALEQARTEEKLLLVDFTATWCQPCKRMDRDTWADPVVRVWIAQHAIAIQIDVDEEPALSKELEVEAMPTVIAIREGELFDRAVGYQAPSDFIPWAYGILKGERPSDDLLERSELLMLSSDVDARYDIAKDLHRADHHAEALEHYLWLWPASRDAPGMGGVRLSFMLSDMAQLAQAHEPAKRAFLGLIEELQGRVDEAETPTFTDWREWSSLCEYFGEQARVLAWYEKRRDENGELFAGTPKDHVQGHIAGEIFDILLEAERFPDAAKLIGNGVQKAKEARDQHRQSQTMLARLDDEMRPEIEQLENRSLAEELSKIHAILLLSGSDDQAGEVAGMLIETLDSPASRTALVRWGIKITGTAHASFATWLDEAEQAGDSVRALRKRLENLAVPREATDDGK